MPRLRALSVESVRSMYDELEKIAGKLDPTQIVGAVAENLSLRKGNMNSLRELMQPGRSLVGGLAENFRNWRGGRKVKSEAFKELSKLRSSLDPSKAKTLAEQNEVLSNLAKVRSAERGLADVVGSKAPKPSFFATPQASPAKGSALRNIAFGAGLGAAGLGALQYKLNHPSDPYAQ